jgi:hypothetical protein
VGSNQDQAGTAATRNVDDTGSLVEESWSIDAQIFQIKSPAHSRETLDLAMADPEVWKQLNNNIAK